MAEKEKQHPLISKPLYLYSLPPELLNTLTLKGDALQQLEETPVITETVEKENSEPGGAGCLTCNIASFVDTSVQRDHFRSDLHKFNLKRKLTDQKIVNADEFDKMLDGTLFIYFVNNRPERIYIWLGIR
jgi:hypothetical protein